MYVIDRHWRKLKMWLTFWILKRKQCIGGSWIRTNENGKLLKLSSERNRMSPGKDALIEFLMELLKEERDQRRKETEENASLIKDLMSKFEKLEMDLILECNLYRPLCRIVCDGDDEIDGWFPNILGNSNHRHMFPTPSRHVQAWVWNFLTPEIITG